MKKRGMASPDLGDALAMTFSVTVRPRPTYEEPTLYEQRLADGQWHWS